MFRFLIFLLLFSGCTNVSNLIKEAPKQDYCILLTENSSIYLNCYNEPSDQFYDVEGVDVQNYVAVSQTSIIELIAWVRKAEAILSQGLGVRAEADMEENVFLANLNANINQSFKNAGVTSFSRKEAVEIDLNEVRKYLKSLRAYRRSLERRLKVIKEAKELNEVRKHLKTLKAYKTSLEKKLKKVK